MNESSEPQLKISPKMIVIGACLLIAYLLIKPTLEAQFGWELPGFGDKAEVAQDDGKQSSGKDSSFDETLESITGSVKEPGKSSQQPADQTSIAMGDQANATQPKSSTPKNTKPTPNVATKPPITSKPNTKTNDNPSPNVATKPPLKTNPKAPAQPDLGQLKELSGKVYESTAGLRYTPGSIDKHRLMHVMKHAEDNLEKPVHGVFNVEKKEILILLDQAWELTKKRGPPQVRKEEERGRTAYTIDMKKPIGYVGGQSGKSRNNPKCFKIKLVLEGNEVITAYPTQ